MDTVPVTDDAAEFESIEVLICYPLANGEDAYTFGWFCFPDDDDDEGNYWMTDVAFDIEEVSELRWAYFKHFDKRR